MLAHRLSDTVQCLATPDFHRRWFDSLVPIPDGTSYNAYLVTGSDKTVLIDTVEPSMAAGLMSMLGGVPRIDWVVSLHAEQDHSGSIPLVLERFPDAKVLCSPKAQGMLADLLHLPAGRLHAVADGEQLSLGDGTLQFLHMPWVHWPETMVALLEEEGILFSCDLFGSHLATSRPTVEDPARLLDAAKRYYAGIMMPFAKFIDKHLTRLDSLDVRQIAPSHGPVHDAPEIILDAYRRWVRGKPANRVVVVYETMHHSTEAMVNHLTEALVARGIAVEPFRLSETDVGRLAMTLLDTPTLVFGTPTVLGGPHPRVVEAAYLIASQRPRIERMAVIASSGWGPAKTVKLIGELTSSLSAKWLDPVLCKGHPDDADRAALDALADAIAAEHADSGLLAAPAG